MLGKKADMARKRGHLHPDLIKYIYILKNPLVLLCTKRKE
jgi:hypothetical protein